MPKKVLEQVRLAEAATSTDKKSGRMKIQVITPGWGSSGYYSKDVCEDAAGLVAVGTQMFIDHPTAAEELERPVRSLKDVAAVVTEAGTWDESLGAVVAECTVTAPYRDFLCDEALAPHIGLSIRGSASDVTVGEAEGRSGKIVESLVAIQSVDFVTRAGRGGKVLQLLESAPPSLVIERAIEHGVEEATADERRQQLSDAVRAEYGGDHQYAWVRDFDESTVWFDASGDDEPSRTWQQSYEAADDDLTVTLTGEREQVRPVTKYVPVTRPGSTSTGAPTTATESEEDTMPKIQIEESEHTRLTETAGRVDAVESENAALKAENTQLKAEKAAGGVIAARVAEAKVEPFTDLETAGLLVGLPLTESGELDEAKFAEHVDKQLEGRPAVTEAVVVTGPTGFGASAPGGGQVTESTRPTKSAWGRDLTVKGA